MIPEHLHLYVQRGRIAQAEAIHDFMQRLRHWLYRRAHARAGATATAALDPAAALKQLKATAAVAEPIGQEIAERIVPDTRNPNPG